MEKDKIAKIYTKSGDSGMTSLMKIQNVPKDDDRVELLGAIDELTSNIGVVKTMEIQQETREQFVRIQKNLMTIMAGIADSYNQEYKLKEEEIDFLEAEIDRLEGLFPRPKHFILPGENKISAQLDVARTVARRAERWMSAVNRKFGVDKNAKKFMNRLADYLYVTARYMDYVKSEEENRGLSTVQARKGDLSMKENEIINAVLQQLSNEGRRLSLETAKRLIEQIEGEAKKRGLDAVIAVCGPDGNTIAVHVMDNAFLASFDIAMKKAYTSVAVKMSTKELGKLAMPGETFYGVDKADNNRLIIFGGGIPLKIGDKIVGGLGISGGVSEDDHSLAQFGADVFAGLFV
ncbi:cob(I)yrinic acid a,c-diamide adenosyltransferase [Konateibacter massiliensis]|uniref:cob(I)yrinic acid a,c-diamide adenosyltransferase n=1 Tax=Konateibacter massiliensis TaxID=2002841 RepID=UPI001F3EFA76|nr:cob(I)yrinic acid a,c-diamide adenosyltransferase [Konateibacter massiliensis]